MSGWSSPARRRIVLAATGLGLLALGAAAVLAPRGAPGGLPASLLAWWGAAASWWPSFAHAAALSLLTAAALPARGGWPYAGCVAWAVVDIAAEFGQRPGLDRVWADAILEGLGRVPGAQALADHLLGGTFDPADVAAVIAGCAAAAAIVRWQTRRPRGRPDG